MRHFLDFEKPIASLEGKVEELRHMSSDGSINIAIRAHVTQFFNFPLKASNRFFKIKKMSHWGSILS